MKKSKYYIIIGILSLFLLSFFKEEDTSDRFEIGKNLDIFTELYKEVIERMSMELNQVI